MEQKVFGYPEFDQNGEQILTTYENEYRAMNMDIRVYRMKAGEEKDFLREQEETAILLLSGKITLIWEKEEETVARKDVFTEGPFALHVCKNVKVRVKAEEDSEILVQCTKNTRSFAGRLYHPEDAPWKYSSKGKFGNVANRRVNTIVDHEINPDSNMVLGEVLNDPGNWSGYLPHRHPQPECYYFKLTIRRGLEPVLSEIRFSRVWTAAFPRFRVANCIRRRWRPGFKCTPAG